MKQRRKPRVKLLGGGERQRDPDRERAPRTPPAAKLQRPSKPERRRLEWHQQQDPLGLVKPLGRRLLRWADVDEMKRRHLVLPVSMEKEQTLKIFYKSLHRKHQNRYACLVLVIKQSYRISGVISIPLSELQHLNLDEPLLENGEVDVIFDPRCIRLRSKGFRLCLKPYNKKIPLKVDLPEVRDSFNQKESGRKRGGHPERRRSKKKPDSTT